MKFKSTEAKLNGITTAAAISQVLYEAEPVISVFRRAASGKYVSYCTNIT